MTTTYRVVLPGGARYALDLTPGLAERLARRGASVEPLAVPAVR